MACVGNWQKFHFVSLLLFFFLVDFFFQSFQVENERKKICEFYEKNKCYKIQNKQKHINKINDQQTATTRPMTLMKKNCACDVEIKYCSVGQTSIRMFRKWTKEVRQQKKNYVFIELLSSDNNGTVHSNVQCLSWTKKTATKLCASQ